MKKRINAIAILTIVWSVFAIGQNFNLRITNLSGSIKSLGQHNYAQFSWQTSTESGFGYYIVQRCNIKDSIWQDVWRVDTLGSTGELKTYSFDDYNISIGTFVYRVKILINDKARAYVGSVILTINSLTHVSNLTDQGIPIDFAIVSNYPNPFNPTTSIVIRLKSTENGSLAIYDLGGRKLEILVNGLLPTGVHQYQWDASKYPSGIYFCILQTQNQTSTAKLVLQK